MKVHTFTHIRVPKCVFVSHTHLKIDMLIKTCTCTCWIERADVMHAASGQEELVNYWDDALKQVITHNPAHKHKQKNTHMYCDSIGCAPWPFSTSKTSLQVTWKANNQWCWNSTYTHLLYEQHHPYDTRPRSGKYNPLTRVAFYWRAALSGKSSCSIKVQLIICHILYIMHISLAEQKHLLYSSELANNLGP